MLNRDTKVKLVTHNDLDGIGCEILGRLAFSNIDVTVVKNPKDASDKVAKFVESGEFTNYDKIFITDISINDATAKLIDNLEWESNRFALLDHHGTAKYLNKYDWASVNTSSYLGKEAGTNMFFDYLVMNGFFRGGRYIDALTIFVEKIRRYDSWEWKDIYNDTEASSLNQLFWLMGREVFVKNYLNKFNKGEIFIVSEGSWLGMFTEVEDTIITLDNDKKNAYIDRKEEQMIRTKLLGHPIGLVFSEQYTSELGNVLAERNLELDFIVLVDMGSRKVSYRSIRDDLDLGKDIAKNFGGGGHPKASGSEFSDRVLKQAFKLIFNIGFFGKLNKSIDMLTKK